jgi:hypothetical protein
MAEFGENASRSGKALPKPSKKVSRMRKYFALYY